MLAPQHAIVIIPALDEAQSVGRVVASVLDVGVREVVVIDDFSHDDTADKARAAGATVIQLPERLGAWGATQTGLRYAVRRGARAVITMDADGQHNAADIPSLIRPISKSEANVVIASCATRGSALRHVAWGWIKRVSHIEIRDITSGFRSYDRLAVRRLAAWPANLIDFQDVGVLLLLHRYQLSVAEVDVSMNKRRNGKSRIFSSWAAVIYYMAHTLLLGVSKRPMRKFASNSTKAL